MKNILTAIMLATLFFVSCDDSDIHHIRAEECERIEAVIHVSENWMLINGVFYPNSESTAVSYTLVDNQFTLCGLCFCENEAGGIIPPSPLFNEMQYDLDFNEDCMTITVSEQYMAIIEDYDAFRIDFHVEDCPTLEVGNTLM